MSIYDSSGCSYGSSSSYGSLDGSGGGGGAFFFVVLCLVASIVLIGITHC